MKCPIDINVNECRITGTLNVTFGDSSRPVDEEEKPNLDALLDTLDTTELRRLLSRLLAEHPPAATPAAAAAPAPAPAPAPTSKKPPKTPGTKRASIGTIFQMI